jgi:hypothetical protein
MARQTLNTIQETGGFKWGRTLIRLKKRTQIEHENEHAEEEITQPRVLFSSFRGGHLFGNGIEVVFDCLAVLFRRDAVAALPKFLAKLRDESVPQA